MLTFSFLQGATPGGGGGANGLGRGPMVWMAKLIGGRKCVNRGADFIFTAPPVRSQQCCVSVYMHIIIAEQCDLDGMSK